MAYLFDSNGLDGGSERKTAPPQTEELSGYPYFKRRLHEEVLRSQRRSHPFTLMRLALQPAEADTPEEITKLLLTSVREYDLVCHVESNDFAIVLPETALPHAPRIAERICKTLIERVPPQNPAREAVRAKVGIAYFPKDGTNADDLLQSAEQDLRRSLTS